MEIIQTESSIEMKRGIFRIPSKFLKEKPDALADVFALMKFVPVRMEVLLFEDSIEYTGMSHIFSEISISEKIPEYQLHLVYKRDELVQVAASLR